MPALGFELMDCQAWRDAGLPLSTTSNDAAKMYDAVVSQLFGWTEDQAVGGMEGAMKAMLAADPNFVQGRAAASLLNLMGDGRGVTRADASLREAQAVIDLAARSDLNPRDTLYVEALKCLAKGNDMEANGVLCDVLATYPTDRFALKVVAQSYFTSGEMVRMRDVVGRCMPRWDKGLRQYGFLYGMYGFGLEETGNYAAAEKIAKLGCETQRYDPWARHCLSHVYEMTGRPDEGIRHLSSSESDWTHNGVLVCHNYWHWSLYHIEKGEYEEALGIYDSQVGRRCLETPAGLALCDASSTLQRLCFEGVDVGSRWSDLYERSRAHLDTPEHYWSFADAHLMFLACSPGASRAAAPGSRAAGGGEAGVKAAGPDAAAKLLQSAKKFVEEQRSDNRNTMARIGLPLMESIFEYEQGNYEAAVELLYPARYDIVKLGGSDAQRDVFHLFLISAATKSPSERHRKLARSLIAERQSFKEASPLNERLMARLLASHAD